MTTAFGQIVIATQVEYVVRDNLQRYFPTYLREIERQISWEGDALPTPRNYTNRNTYDALPGEELPKVVVISPGLLQRPTHPDSGGGYRAVWEIGVGVAIAAPTEEEADFMCKMYGAAARAILLQHQSLGRDDIVGVYWVDENYDDLPLEEQHANYKSAGIFVGVEVENVVNRFMRPPDVTESPQELSEVERVIINFPEWEHTVTVE